MSEWQDIETAPKDGTWVLGFEPDGEYVESTGFVVMQYHNGAWCREGDDYYTLYVEPTHWQPLPEPSIQPPSKTGERR